MEKITITKKSLINYIILAFFGLAFFVTSLVDPLNNEELYKRITIIKIIFGIFIVLWILVKFYLEMSRLIKRFRVSYGMVKSYDWFLRFENLWTFTKTILLITPFLTLNIYWLLTVSNTIEDFEVFSLELANNLSNKYLNKFSFVIDQKIFLIGATFMWAIFSSLFFATLFYIGYKIAMVRFTNRLRKNIEKISSNCKKTEECSKLLGVNEKEINEEIENREKTTMTTREYRVFTVVKYKFSEMWKDVKKGTWPPRSNYFGEY
ncbi:hypothetical protein SLITO_v1c04580 [Spiroplasma litorale]|uniref:Transmembrane protein n=1 Tax=Spiroplasma litorale TaxID=216942 RepID=A0A0K1W1Q2_9MOLU|nr:hypothetical protein [Spiroplasma litorale]AKX34111.1 hypothetical protein SLITO_v1c04580 [Spiroplasma litorale]